jgi:hypothetical protein
MPYPTGTPTRGQEPVRKLEEHRDSIARRGRHAQIRTSRKQPAVIMIDSPVPKIKRPATEVAAAVVDGEKEPAGQVRKLWLGI